MRRIAIDPRPEWQTIVQSQGLTYNVGDDGTSYWNESAYYEFTEEEIDDIEEATIELQRCSLLAAQHVIEGNELDNFGIPRSAHAAIRASWESHERSVYGRFDLAIDPNGVPKLLEYNADTPTTLVEAAVVQWYWLKDRFPDADQFNSLWERLVAVWKSMNEEFTFRDRQLYFASLTNAEDWMTSTLMRDTAEEAGISTREIPMDAIGWDTMRNVFVDEQNGVIRSMFKLYPWEWMLEDAFGRHVLDHYGTTQWIEPIWKFVLSSKAILPVMWELFPDHPNLLPAFADGPRQMNRYVTKPVISREGSNVSIWTPEENFHSSGPYDSYPKIFQELCPISAYAGNYPVIGSWVIDGAPGGMGIRESDGLITDNKSRFVPHLFNA